MKNVSVTNILECSTNEQIAQTKKYRIFYFVYYFLMFRDCLLWRCRPRLQGTLHIRCILGDGVCITSRAILHNTGDSGVWLILTYNVENSVVWPQIPRYTLNGSIILQSHRIYCQHIYCIFCARGMGC